PRVALHPAHPRLLRASGLLDPALHRLPLARRGQPLRRHPRPQTRLGTRRLAARHPPPPPQTLTPSPSPPPPLLSPFPPLLSPTAQFLPGGVGRNWTVTVPGRGGGFPVPSFHRQLNSCRVISFVDGGRGLAQRLGSGWQELSCRRQGGGGGGQLGV